MYFLSFRVYLYLYLKRICVFASFSGFTCCSLSSSPHQPAFAGKAYRRSLRLTRSLYKWDFNLALGDRFWLFIQTLNNDKKPFNSIFNSKRKSNYSFKKFIHSKTIQNYSFKEFIHSKKIQNYSFKEFIHSNWKKLFKIRSKIC